MVNYFFLPSVFSTVFCLLVASFESLEISAPNNVFRCLMYLVGAPTSNQCKRLKTPPKPKKTTLKAKHKKTLFIFLEHYIVIGDQRVQHCVFYSHMISPDHLNQSESGRYQIQ